MNEDIKTRITDVRTVGVPVRDQDRALEFYVSKLGFEKRLDVPFADGQRWIEVVGDYVPPMFSFRDLDGNRLILVEQA